jgi:hypothetical protein
MQPEKIILLPPTHESLPSFHVRGELLSPFLEHLARSGIKVAEPPEPQGDSKQGTVSVIGVDVQEDIPISKLCQKSQGASGDSQFEAEHPIISGLVLLSFFQYACVMFSGPPWIWWSTCGSWETIP